MEAQPAVCSESPRRSFPWLKERTGRRHPFPGCATISERVLQPLWTLSRPFHRHGFDEEFGGKRCYRTSGIDSKGKLTVVGKLERLIAAARSLGCQ
jgi:hypothetical protein